MFQAGHLSWRIKGLAQKQPKLFSIILKNISSSNADLVSRQSSKVDSRHQIIEIIVSFS